MHDKCPKFLCYRNYDKYFIQALKIRRLIADDFDKVFSQGIDMLLTPTLLGDAPHYDWFSQADNRTRTQEQDVFTQPVNMAGESLFQYVTSSCMHSLCLCVCVCVIPYILIYTVIFTFSFSTLNYFIYE